MPQGWQPQLTTASLRLVGLCSALILSGCVRGDGITAPAAPPDCSQTSYIGQNGYTPSWSGDSREVIYLAGFDAQARFNSGLYRCDVESGESHRVLPISLIGTPRRCHWNPQPGSTEVLLDYGLSAAIIDMESGNFRWVAPDAGRLLRASWTPEGDSIAYAHAGSVGEGEFSSALAIQAPDGSGRHFFVREGQRAIRSGEFVFSPDGKWLAWPQLIPSDVYSDVEIAVVRRDGTGYRVLTNLGGQAGKPVWINNGTGLLFPWKTNDCARQGGNGPSTTMYVDLSSGNVRKWQAELTDYRFQFGNDIHVDPTGTRALIPAIDPLFNVPVGVLYLTSTNYTGVRRKLALTSPAPFEP